MDALKKWLNSKSQKDRNALLILAIVVPTIIFWWGVTNPLIERQSMAKRVLIIKRKQAKQLINSLSDFIKIKSKTYSKEVKSSKNIMPDIEQLIGKLPNNTPKPSISRINILINGSRQSGAEFRFTNLHAKTLWKLFNLIAKSKLVVASLDLGSSRSKDGFTGFIRVWKPMK